MHHLTLSPAILHLLPQYKHFVVVRSYKNILSVY